MSTINKDEHFEELLESYFNNSLLKIVSRFRKGNLDYVLVRGGSLGLSVITRSIETDQACYVILSEAVNVKYKDTAIALEELSSLYRNKIKQNWGSRLGQLKLISELFDE